MLGGRVAVGKGRKLVQIAMIKDRNRLAQVALDDLKIDGHADLIEPSGLDLDLDPPIMAMQLSTRPIIPSEGMGRGKVIAHA